MSEHDRLRALLDRLEPPGPPADLRRRAVGAAHRALREPANPDVWTRLWESRPLRLAWATAVLVLLAGHGVVSLRPATRGEAVTATGHGSGLNDPELRAVAELPPIDLAAHSFAVGASSPASDQDPSTISGEENPS